MKEFFHKISHSTSNAVGTPWAFMIALLIVIIWVFTGPIFKYSDTWQLVINTGTTIITFLMVFLIQNSQNRDSRAIHLKLDEIIRSINEARNDLIDLEDSSDEDLQKITKEMLDFKKKL